MRIWKAAFAAVVVSLIGMGVASSQDWPSRPIKIIVPFAPGGSTDIIGRLVANQLGHDLGQSVIVENVGGAAGAIGTMQVDKAPADGYTLAIATVSTMVVYQSAQSKPEYSVEDFIPITNIASMPNVLSVGPTIKAKDLKELIQLLKANPGKYTFATSGIGSINHLLGESFQAYAGVKLLHVPYKGSGPGMQAVMGEQVDMIFDQFPSSKGAIDTGQLRGMGIISPRRVPGYDIMTMEEAGLKGFTDEAWYGLLAPGKTPPDVVAKLADAMHKVIANPDFRTKLENIGARPVGNSPAEFKAQILREVEQTKKVVKERNIKFE